MVAKWLQHKGKPRNEYPPSAAPRFVSQDIRENAITADDVSAALRRAGAVELDCSEPSLKRLTHVQHICRCAVCDVWCVVCSAQCDVQCAVCGCVVGAVRCAVFAVCGVRCLRCVRCVWCVICGFPISRLRISDIKNRGTAPAEGCDTSGGFQPSIFLYQVHDDVLVQRRLLFSFPETAYLVLLSPQPSRRVIGSSVEQARSRKSYKWLCRECVVPQDVLFARALYLL